MSEAISPPEWIEQELRTVDLGDRRLNHRLGSLLEELSGRPEASIHAACSGHKETMAAYRFFNHPDLDEQAVLAPHAQATLERVRQHPRVLAVQDTTETDYSRRQPIAGAGPLSDDHSQGFYLHPLLAVTPERLCLGTLHLRLWARPELGRKATRHQRPLEEKESYRWLEGYRAACAVARQCPQTQIIAVGDRESDIYELYEEAQRQGRERAEYIVRASQDRRTDGRTRKLWAQAAASPVLGRVGFRLPPRRDQPARAVTVSVRACEICLRAPHRPQGRRPPQVKVWAVLAREIHPPPGVERVEWLLLTSLPVRDLAEAVAVLRWYGCRWEVEIFFRVWKQGCRIERVQLERGPALRAAMAFYMIVAWRILYLTMLGRTVPQLSCAAVFAEAEWKAVWMVVQRQAPPPQAPPLKEMIHLVAHLGGYKGRKGDGEPGPKAMWEGMRRVLDLALAWNTFGPEAKTTYV
jgi:Transposase DNA-binding/Transposase Tn5 dimerisation domain